MQVDLFHLIGGSWPPAPKEPEKIEYGSLHRNHKGTMQRPHNERIKSVNLLAHLAPERRRNKPTYNTQSPSVSEDIQPKMVHEPKKIETGILVDICNAEAAPEELYDSPALGSPRAAPTQSKPSPVHVPEDIGVGSLVEVATDVDQHYYGVVRWIGVIDDTATAGVELEQSPDCPVVPGVVPPLNSLGELAGKNRGIQGHHNSCYLDATLFAMFTFTSVFDALLYRPPEPEDSPHYSEVQRVLREEIVNPLRKHGYVRADRVMKLRTLLERLSDVPGLTSEEKDPEEFLNGLVAQLLRAEPFLKLSSGQEAYCYQLFVEKDEHVAVPTVQQLLEQSFTTSGVKLSEVPAAFIIQMPRFGKQYKLYQKVIPSPLAAAVHGVRVAGALGVRGVRRRRARGRRALRPLPVCRGSARCAGRWRAGSARRAAAPRSRPARSATTASVPRQCTVCGSLARWECAACGGAALEAGALCDHCRRLAHHARPHHKAVPLTVNEEYVNILESCPVPRVYMELFAVLCIETSHYVAFVKAGVGHDAPWCFFDSMADRKGERNGYNIPEIVCISELGAWLGEDARAAPPPDRQLPAHARRLLADAYMCFYRSPDVAMYR
ncbi:hypothetical protein HW555_011209 [Spodoptera exigua]|uniref:USP domain-containing protein n=1 Tax=Spodoptera exigua TaxID=7107 RepID=A0A835L074_SPOEX|nr:hypothetical protein HW555_011209 [Spodoptera exigua]